MPSKLNDPTREITMSTLTIIRSSTGFGEKKASSA